MDATPVRIEEVLHNSSHYAGKSVKLTGVSAAYKGISRQDGKLCYEFSLHDDGPCSLTALADKDRFTNLPFRLSRFGELHVTGQIISRDCKVPLLLMSHLLPLAKVRTADKDGREANPKALARLKRSLERASKHRRQQRDLYTRVLQNRLKNLLPIFDRGGIVYLVTCTAPGPDEGKRYVGLTTQDLLSRQCGHWRSMMEPIKEQEPLYAAMRKYPNAAFQWEVIARATNWEELRRSERAAIAELGTHVSTGRGFNLSYGGEGITPLARFLTLVTNAVGRQRSYFYEEMYNRWRLSIIDKRSDQFPAWANFTDEQTLSFERMIATMPHDVTKYPTLKQTAENIRHWVAWYEKQHHRLPAIAAKHERNQESELQDRVICSVLGYVLIDAPIEELETRVKQTSDPAVTQMIRELLQRPRRKRKSPKQAPAHL